MRYHDLVKTGLDSGSGQWRSLEFIGGPQYLGEAVDGGVHRIEVLEHAQRWVFTDDVQIGLAYGLTADGLDVSDLRSDEVLSRYVSDLAAGTLPWQRTHAGSYIRVFWWVVDGQYIGRISIRPDLNPGEMHDNHIGYAIRPTRRRQGHASRMPAAALPLAFALGVDPVVIVCRSGNLASRRVVENNGGKLLAVLDDRHHYVCHQPPPTSP
ncbi:putative acetyltransferase [Actinocorallia herbida]|uniref:Putative acetyltransferase n=1 Tax=Actinocorallia herbida TaxID=58109 RepID=A0A3N1D2N7_9ACTN|nr:GNAT family N-acetyltransferase [Actinocorallia herbida]ROO87799.1 putative acetyltransferase [Actinocorallia herbida]